MLLTEIAEVIWKWKFSTQEEWENRPLEAEPKEVQAYFRLNAKAILSKILEAVDGAGLKPEEILRAINDGRKGNKKDARDGVLVSASIEYMLDHKYVINAQLQAIKKLFEVEKQLGISPIKAREQALGRIVRYKENTNGH